MSRDKIAALNAAFDEEPKKVHALLSAVPGVAAVNAEKFTRTATIHPLPGHFGLLDAESLRKLLTENGFTRWSVTLYRTA